MELWCSLYNCWCSDVDSIIDAEELVYSCSCECENCGHSERVGE